MKRDSQIGHTADSMCKAISKCRVCGSHELISLMNIGNQALTGIFPRAKGEEVKGGPVELVKCVANEGCGLVQLRHSYELSEMYGMNYGYRSGLNPSMVHHLHSKVAAILRMDVLHPGDLVLDIGSNDGTTLRAYPPGNYQLAGIDPTGIKFAAYYPESVELITDFFSANVVVARFAGKKAKVVTSFSMFYDLEDPVAFAREIEKTLQDDGVWIFEQSYLPAMLRTNSFDTICHEHLEFYALKQINWILAQAGMKALDVEFNDINGGSFSIIAAKESSGRKQNSERLAQILQEERDFGLDGTDVYEGFKARVEKCRSDLMTFLLDAKHSGKRVCGLGASTKGNVLLQYFGIDETLLESIGEVNEDKFGSYTPGTLIPMVSERDLLASNPDYLLVLPWHFRMFFESLPVLKGRTLVFPLPTFEIVRL